MKNLITKTFIDLAEKSILPDFVIRYGIRNLCKERLKEYRSLTPDQQTAYQESYLATLKASPIAFATQSANDQHYEVKPEFYRLVLGKNLKYSSCFYSLNASTDPSEALNQAEEEALSITMERAQLEDGQDILELGCGWGSLSLAMARKFPKSKITAISNSKPQRLYIEEQAKNEGLTNLKILTFNLNFANDLDLPKFDRIVSVEMMEHVRNYEAFLKRCSDWLHHDGKMFVHIFTHREYPYPFETEGEDNWMGKHFFTGGQMPSHDLFFRTQDHLKVESTWAWNGTHYGRTSDGWLHNLDKNYARILELFSDSSHPRVYVQRWRMFFMACSELFGFDQGREWGVSHYLFSKRSNG